MSTKDEGHGYGAVAIIVLTISIVVGSGIFFKNDELMQANNSAIITMMSWFIVTGFVLTILYSYIEISSSTTKTGEIGSLSAWGSKLFNNKTGRIIGYFFVYVNLPINTALLSIYSSDLIFSLIDQYANILPNSEAGYAWLRTIFISLMALAIITPIGLLNSQSNSRSKDIQNFGFFVKIIPIIFIVGIFVVALGLTSFSDGITGFGGVWNVGSDTTKNSGLYVNNNPDEGLKSTISLITILVISMPPVMFAFDGFIYSANLQSETKSKKSFASGLTIAIILIAIFYILVSFAMLSLGDGTSFSLFDIVANAFPNAAWVPTLFDVMLILSIISGMSGLFAASIRATSSLSADNMVRDKDFKLIQKNKHGVASKAGHTYLAIVVGWILLLRIFDAISVYDQVANTTLTAHSAGTSYMAMSGFSGNIAVSLAYLFYVFIIFGGVLNRRHKKVEVDELPYFKTVAWISIIGITFIATFSILSIFNTSYHSITSFLNIGLFVIMVGIMIACYLINDKRLKHLDQEFLVKKEVEVEKYYSWEKK